MSPAILAMWMPGPIELVVIGIVALLVFGRRLPDVARSLGKSIVEFKKGIREVKDDIEVQSSLDSSPRPRLERQQPTTPPPAAWEAPQAPPAPPSASRESPRPASGEAPPPAAP